MAKRCKRQRRRWQQTHEVDEDGLFVVAQKHVAYVPNSNQEDVLVIMLTITFSTIFV